MTFTILDVYPPKFDRIKKIIWPPESSHQGASFEARFAHDSLSKTYSFSWNTEFCFSNVLDVYPSKIDCFWELFAPSCSSRPCASFCFLIHFSHPLKINTFFMKKHLIFKKRPLPGPSGTPDTYILRLGIIFNTIPAHFQHIFKCFSTFSKIVAPNTQKNMYFK